MSDRFMLHFDRVKLTDLDFKERTEKPISLIRGFVMIF
jgi:hypothetical protein